MGVFGTLKFLAYLFISTYIIFKCRKMFTQISSDNLRNSIIRIMKEENLDPMSPSVIHSQLEKDLGVDLADRNQEVMTMINETLNANEYGLRGTAFSMDEKNGEESKDNDDIEVEMPGINESTKI